MRVSIMKAKYEKGFAFLQKEGRMPIIMAPLNQEVTVVKILTDEKVKKHLENLGITIDSKLTVLSDKGSGVVLVVKDGRLALDKNMATKIIVRVEE